MRFLALVTLLAVVLSFGAFVEPAAARHYDRNIHQVFEGDPTGGLYGFDGHSGASGGDSSQHQPLGPPPVVEPKAPRAGNQPTISSWNVVLKWRFIFSILLPGHVTQQALDSSRW